MDSIQKKLAKLAQAKPAKLKYHVVADGEGVVASYATRAEAVDAAKKSAARDKTGYSVQNQRGDYLDEFGG